MITLLLKAKKYLKNNYPLIFNFFKKIAQLPFLINLNEMVSPPTERFDPERVEAEFEYFKAYTGGIKKEIKRLLANNTDINVLDLGCGLGYFTKQLADMPQVKRVFALDKIKKSQFRFSSDPKIEYYSVDITSLTENTSITLPKCLLIVSTEFVEHILEDNFVEILPWVKSHLAPGGFFIGSTPTNYTEEKRYSGSPFHMREYQPDYFKRLLLDNGFKEVSVSNFGNFFIWSAR